MATQLPPPDRNAPFVYRDGKISDEWWEFLFSRDVAINKAKEQGDQSQADSVDLEAVLANQAPDRSLDESPLSVVGLIPKTEDPGITLAQARAVVDKTVDDQGISLVQVRAIVDRAIENVLKLIDLGFRPDLLKSKSGAAGPTTSDYYWVSDSDTWVYVSATSFKIAGKDVTSRFPVGSKITFSQTTGGTKYFYVVGAAFSTDTTVTVAAGSDYAITSETITGPKYSYTSCPPGFPHWFNHAEAWGGFTAIVPTGGTCRFKINGRTVTFSVQRTSSGVSNLGTTTVTLPVQAVTLSGYSIFGLGRATDSGMLQQYPAEWNVTSGATTASLFKAVNSSYAAILGKNFQGTITYEI